MEKNIFQLTEEYLKDTDIKSRIPAATNTQAMSYEYSNLYETLDAVQKLMRMIQQWSLEWIEVHCQIRDNKYFVTVEELDPDEFEEE